MKTLVYAGTELTTGDDIALAVLAYCVALAEARTAEMIEIPVLTPGGERSTATFLVGPASQMVAIDVDAEGEEIVDHETVARLRDRTRAHHPKAHGFEQEEQAVFLPADLDW